MRRQETWTCGRLLFLIACFSFLLFAVFSVYYITAVSSGLRSHSSTGSDLASHLPSQLRKFGFGEKSQGETQAAGESESESSTHGSSKPSKDLPSVNDESATSEEEQTESGSESSKAEAGRESDASDESSASASVDPSKLDPGAEGSTAGAQEEQETEAVTLQRKTDVEGAGELEEGKEGEQEEEKKEEGSSLASQLELKSEEETASDLETQQMASKEEDEQLAEETSKKPKEEKQGEEKEDAEKKEEEEQASTNEATEAKEEGDGATSKAEDEEETTQATEKVTGAKLAEEEESSGKPKVASADDEGEDEKGAEKEVESEGDKEAEKEAESEGEKETESEGEKESNKETEGESDKEAEKEAEGEGEKEAESEAESEGVTAGRKGHGLEAEEKENEEAEGKEAEGEDGLSEKGNSEEQEGEDEKPRKAKKKEKKEQGKGSKKQGKGKEKAQTGSGMEGGKRALGTFPVCNPSLTEIIPCLDHKTHKRMKLRLSTALMEHYERHCPTEDFKLHCLVPPPKGYTPHVRWPESRDRVWKANVPHTFLATEKADQHWMEVEGDIVTFPGGGTHFHGGADKYIQQMGKMLGDATGDLSLGGKIRTVLDVGCGVASFGAFLLKRKVLAMSLAPNDVHQNQIQFALERGIPALLGVLGTQRLPFPSKSFELAHCSRCRIDWAQRDGVLLLEIDRLLRPGGYWAWSAPPAYRNDAESTKLWTEFTDLTSRMCWKLVAREEQTAIFQKPTSGECFASRKKKTPPPMCPASPNPDEAWYTAMGTCIAGAAAVEEEGANGWTELEPWPARLTTPPQRVKDAGVTEAGFKADTKAWKRRVAAYWKLLGPKVTPDAIRNVMDMNSNLGGFGAALNSKPVWVMNTVPPSEKPETLRVVYDRGLLGMYHDWCESFSTYPRTYDLLHAPGLVSLTSSQGCSLDSVLLEMDRILRPRGFVIFRDSPEAIKKVEEMVPALRWKVWAPAEEAEADGASVEGGGKEQVLVVRKKLWRVASVEAGKWKEEAKKPKEKEEKEEEEVSGKGAVDERSSSGGEEEEKGAGSQGGLKGGLEETEETGGGRKVHGRKSDASTGEADEGEGGGSDLEGGEVDESTPVKEKQEESAEEEKEGGAAEADGGAALRRKGGDDEGEGGEEGEGKEGGDGETAATATGLGEKGEDNGEDEAN